ncbi:MAG: S8 family serine peptidase [Phycisphaerae bacterium]
MKRFLNNTIGNVARGLVLAACLATSVTAVGQDVDAFATELDFQQQAEQAQLTALEPLAVQVLAAGRGFEPGALSIAYSAVARFPNTGVIAFSFKVQDAAGGLHSVILDESGLELSDEDLVNAEREAREARFGKLEPALAEILPNVGENELVPVMIWLRNENEVEARRPEPQEITDPRALEFSSLEARQGRLEAVAATVAPLGDYLAELGFQPTHATSAPIIYAALDAKTIEEVNSLPEVDTIYLEPQNNENELNVARVVIRASTVNSRGFRGSGERVAITEYGGGRVPSNPYLAGIVEDLTDSCDSAHGTAVAGMVRSTHTTHTGIASQATVRIGGSCDGDSSEMHDASQRAADWGAKAINLSWGSDTNRVLGGHDRFYDNLVIWEWTAVVKSAGNRGGAGCSQGTDGDVTSPGLGYNIITVGNLDDKGTTSTTGDTMNPCSSWGDPISAHMDREKPDIAAPGTSITSTTMASPWVANTGSGTSYAAPMVTGGIALLNDRNASLRIWPEAHRAILMATALQNVEGAARLSEKDGAGGINLDRADDVARGVNGNWGARNYDCSAASSLDVLNMALVAGKRTRVVIAWDSNPDYSDYNNRPSADLDLQVIAPNGSSVASSLSFDNTAEIVDFTPSVSGTYKIRVNKYRCSYTPSYLGYAWYRMP